MVKTTKVKAPRKKKETSAAPPAKEKTEKPAQKKKKVSVAKPKKPKTSVVRKKKTSTQQPLAVADAKNAAPFSRIKKREVVVVKPAKQKEIIVEKPKRDTAEPVPETVIEKMPAPQPVPAREAIAAPIAPAVRRKIHVNEMITAKTFAEKLDIRVNELIKKMLSMKVLMTINQRIGRDVCIRIANEYACDVEWVPLYGDAQILKEKDDPPETLQFRPPIVTVMGHVDHGKTSLLDAIRKTNVVSREAGGITQHIGAYRVKTRHGEISFLDTPGHEAFTAMRARGSQSTDIVVIVIAADDGVMPQTAEAIDHARAANVPIIVAINKIDLPAADIQKTKQQLTQYNLAPEEWGGKTICVEISATVGTNIDKLLEMILLQAEMMELKANPDRPAIGTVIEAQLDPKRGPVATVLVQKGTLRVGDPYVAGIWSGRVRALIDDRGRHVRDAGPGIPVKILGLSGTPQAGDRLIVVESEKEARIIADRRQSISREEKLFKRKHVTLEDFNKRITEGKIKDLKVILKADVQGSVGALRDSLDKLSSPLISVNILHYGVGGIVESDVILAAASDAIIIGFNVRPELSAEKMAEREGVDVRTYRVIYEAVADVRAAMEGLLDPETKEVSVGRAEVRQVFKVPKLGVVAGTMVVDGYVERNAFIRLLRDNIIIHEGRIISLRRFKDDVKQVDNGYECGIGIEKYQDIKKGDFLEVYIKEKVKRKLEV